MDVKWIGCGIVIGIAGYIGYKIYPFYKIFKDIKVAKATEAVIHDHYISIPYVYNNKSFTVRVPFDKEKVVEMAKLAVYGQKDGTQTLMTQQPGVPYLLSAKDMNMDNIYVYDLEDEEQDKIYTDIPYYCYNINNISYLYSF